MIVNNVFEFADLDEMITGGYIAVNKHPTADLWIYNYTARTQYDNMWTPTTMACRGLIVDGPGDVVARPFPKFFNLEQVENLPGLPFEVYEKLDGSLGILYWIDDRPAIATRGSFASEQAVAANAMLAGYDTAHLDRDCTYLFEIVYPQNRIVVDYGQRRELVLLAIIETKTGKEYPLQSDAFPVARRIEDVTEIRSLASLNLQNQEGFVVRFTNGLRVKIKMADYVRLHRLLTGISEKRILEEYLIPGRPLDELIENVPDEFHAWVQSVVDHFITDYQWIEDAALGAFRSIHATDRRGYAVAYKRTPYPAILFNMLDGKPYAHSIWKMINGNLGTFRKDTDL